MAKILIMGSGAWGTALATVLIENPINKVTVFGKDEQQISDLKNGKNIQIFGPEITFKKPFLVTNSLKDVSDEQDIIVIAVPTKYLIDILELLVNKITKKTVIVCTSKGFYRDSGLPCAKIVYKYFPENQICSLVGPSFAIDTIEKQFTCVDITNDNLKGALIVKKAFDNCYFKTFVSEFPYEAAFWAAMKNALAIGCGMLSQLSSSINTLAAFLTIGIEEIASYLKIKGYDDKATLSFSAIGDTFLTCTSQKSRNYQFGMLVVNSGIENALNSKATVEGLAMIINFQKLIENVEIETPLFNLLFEIVENRLDPKKLLINLWKKL